MTNEQTQARVLFRDFDGRVRLVSKRGPSRTAAERALQNELANRQTRGGAGAIVASMPLMRLSVAVDSLRPWTTKSN